MKMQFSKMKRAVDESKWKRNVAVEPRIYAVKHIDQIDLLRLCKYITNCKIAFIFWTLHMSVSLPAVCDGLPTVLFFEIRIPFTFMRRIESVWDNSVSGEQERVGEFAVPNKRLQKTECREFKDKSELCYRLQYFQQRVTSE